MKIEEKEQEQVKGQSKSQTHHGHAIKRLRRDRGLSQKDLASLIGMSAQTLSSYEARDVIKDDILERVAKGLNVSVDLIKELEEDKTLAFYIENNTVTNENSSNFMGNNTVGTIENPKEDKSLEIAFNKLEKAYQNSQKQYESTIEAYKEMVEILKKENQELKERKQ